MAGVNKAILVGHLGRDPEISYSQKGLAIARLSLATTEKYDGEDRTEWHRIVCFGRLAEICGEYLTKGRLIYIEGRIQTRSWEDQSGVKKYSTEVVGYSMQMLGGAPRGGASQDYESSERAEKPSPKRAPEAKKTQVEESGDDYMSDYGPPPTDDEIPF